MSGLGEEACSSGHSSVSILVSAYMYYGTPGNLGGLTHVPRQRYYPIVRGYGVRGRGERERVIPCLAAPELDAPLLAAPDIRSLRTGLGLGSGSG